ncbi:hypothetical protein [Aeromicrobium sp. UC242_57]|uniref:hypothetical protein n=1 Tax=Aeromicrobium sp. UC242_57 TaxID=3374624 RepID=UPI0037AB0098
MPRGATQLGPLFRYRSARLIAAYQPELAAAEAQKAAEDADKVAEDEANGTPSPHADARADDASQPRQLQAHRGRAAARHVDLADAHRRRPDRRLPSDAGPDQRSRPDREPRSRQPCDPLPVQGPAHHRLRRVGAGHDRRQARDPDQADRRSRRARDPHLPSGRPDPPGHGATVDAVGDPRTDQLGSDTGSLSDVADVKSTSDTSGLLWPKMDEDAPLDTPLVNGWTLPTDSTLLLSGFATPFAVTTNASSADADQLAEQFVVANNPQRTPRKDVVEDLNSVSTTYSVRTKDGSTARAVYVLSARGNYTAFFYIPAA